jgi:hypothetical protein
MFGTEFSSPFMAPPLLSGFHGRRDDTFNLTNIDRSAHALTPGQLKPNFKSDAYVVNPSFSTNEGLDKYFSVLNNHLKHTERLGQDNGSSVGTLSGPLQSGSMRKILIGADGRRLPSVVKKAVPLPPEDIRAIPHMRSPPRVDSPPVVSVGMIDTDGIPIPWSRTSELLAGMNNAPSGPLGPRKSSPSADELRLTIRDDFDALEAFIEQAFSGSTGAN